MSKQKRYLITTADEVTWKFDRPVIFLGEWCRLYNRKHIWRAMDSVVAKPYGLSAVEKEIDYFNAIRLEKKLFSEFCLLLNEYHKTKHDNRFWSIFIGHWFRSTIQMLLNRVNTLQQCFLLNEISETTLYKSEYCSLAPPDFSTALNLYNNDKWNNVLNSRIIELLDNVDISIKYSNDKNTFFTHRGFTQNHSNLSQSLKKTIIKCIQESYIKISSKFIQNKDAFIISSYLPIKEDIKLYLALGQWPQMWQRINIKIEEKPDQKLRKDLTKQFEIKTDNNLENMARKLLFELLPVYYLESLKMLKKIVNEQPWPKSPKFIFTSNDFYTHEIFKLWTALHVESGTKYYIGQHGNNYFTKKYEFPRIEEKTSDKFLTWGWENTLPKYIPAFNFKLAGKKPIKYNTNGGLLLIETAQKIKKVTFDATSEHIEYFKDQKKFVNQLKSLVREKLTIRLPAVFLNRKFNEDSRWRDFDPALKIDNGIINIRHLVADSRLVVHSYDSTGILETFSQNIPTLAFWQNDFDHLRESVKSDYKLMVDAGIFYLSAESIARKVNKIWNNVDEWWNQKSVQDAKDYFCKRYTKKSKDPTKTLVNIFKED